MQKLRTFLICLAILMLTVITGYTNPEKTKASDDEFNKPGNTLITISDEIIEINLDGDVVWRYESKSLPGHPSGIFIQGDQPHIGSAVRLSNSNTLITETKNNRVIEVNRKKQIVWSYGSDKGWFGNASGYLACPRCAFPTRDGNILITDSENVRILEVTRDHRIVWSLGRMNRWGFNIPPDYQKFSKLYYETPGYNVSLSKKDPYEFALALPLENGNILFMDRKKDTAFEITKKKKVVWSLRFSGTTWIEYHSGLSEYLFPGYKFLKLLPEGYFDFPHSKMVDNFLNGLTIDGDHLLLSDCITEGNAAVVFETDKKGGVVWKYIGERRGSRFIFAQRIGNVPLPLKK